MKIAITKSHVLFALFLLTLSASIANIALMDNIHCPHNTTTSFNCTTDLIEIDVSIGMSALAIVFTVAGMCIILAYKWQFRCDYERL